MGIMRESCGAGGPPNRPLRVGFYDIKETLGKGNFAVVKLAQHRVTNTQVDFGFGNFYKEGQALNTWCGSPPYAAPEVFQGQEYEGPPLDVWSLGVVLYVLLCGTFPFDAPNLPTLRQRVLEGRFRIPYFMSQDCESLIRRMLVVDPAKRLTIGQIKQHRWVQTGDYLPPIPDALSPAPPCLQVLSLMQSLGIDRERTLQALRNDSYNHYAAIYFLLVERLQEPRLGALTPPSPGPAAQNPPSCPAGFHRPESCRLPPWVPVPAGPYERCCPAPLSAQSATPVLQAQGSVAQNGLLPITFQEGRRASDTSLTQGAVALRQLRKSIRVRGLFSLSKIRAMNRQRGVRCTHTSHSPPQSGRDPKVFLQDVLQQQRLLQITVSPPSPKLLPQDPSDQCAPLLPYSYSAALGRPLQAGGQILTPCNTDCGVQATPPGTHSCVLLA
uniref:non-specific serine/threonine protein kinase n=1 Tax=Xenopus tropicalis TaxID=8364 RepID=A0A1B8XXU3_XENTR